MWPTPTPLTCFQLEPRLSSLQFSTALHCFLPPCKHCESITSQEAAAAAIRLGVGGRRRVWEWRKNGTRGRIADGHCLADSELLCHEIYPASFSCMLVFIPSAPCTCSCQTGAAAAAAAMAAVAAAWRRALGTLRERTLEKLTPMALLCGRVGRRRPAG